MPAIARARDATAPRRRACAGALIDPLADATWDGLVGSHPDASFFHTAAWARVLTETYQHKPFYFADRRGGTGASLLPVIEVNSPLLGRRGVSLPFTDWCPLLDAATGSAVELFDEALEFGRERGWRYLETRGGAGGAPGSAPSVSFHGHTVALCSDEGRMFAAMESSVRRGVRKASASPLRVECSTAPASMREYYDLHCRTRRRHGVPPQPFRFFDAILRHVLAAGHGQIIGARLDGRMVAAAVFFHHGTNLIYKFGASEVSAQEHRPNNLVLWEAMRQYSARGFQTLHLGRTSLDNEGLRRFKLGLGACEERIEYRRFHYAKNRFVATVDRAESRLNRVFRLLPVPLLRWVGARCYPHLA